MANKQETTKTKDLTAPQVVSEPAETFAERTASVQPWAEHQAKAEKEQAKRDKEAQESK